MLYYELRPEETEEALAFRNSNFSNVTLDHWKAMECTGVVARGESNDFKDDPSYDANQFDGKITGFIPLQFRNQLIRPDVSIPVVYENAVGTHEKLRSKGIGGHMIDAAAEFIADRADALFVLRGGETSIGYRFYRKSGHSDLCYQSSFVLPVERRLSHQTGSEHPVSGEKNANGKRWDVREVTRQEWIDSEATLLDIHRTSFSDYGGGRVREPGYWTKIANGHVFRENSWRYLFAYSKTREVEGYALIAKGTWEKKEASHIYEIAGRSEGIIESLLDATIQMQEADLYIPSVSLANPLRPLLSRLGFATGRSEPQIMARIANPTRLFGRLRDSTNNLPAWWNETKLVCETPHRAAVLQDVERPACVISLEMKEHTLARMLCCRVDVVSSAQNEMIRCRVESAERNTDKAIEVLGRICRPAPWIQWYSDYV